MARYAWYPQTFPQGKVAVSTKMQFIDKTTGLAYPTQQDNISTWPDGSLKMAVFQCDLGSSTANVSCNLVANGQVTSGTPPTITQAIAGGLQAIVTIVDGGTTYTVNLQSLLQGSGVTTMLSGPLCTEWDVIDAPRTSGGVAHTYLVCHIQARYWANGEGRIVIGLRNTHYNTSGRGPRTYNLSVSVGGVSVYSNASFLHPWGTIIGFEKYYNTTNNRYAHQNVAYLVSTKALMRTRADAIPTAASLNALTSSWAPMQRGEIQQGWDATGDGPHLGPVSFSTGHYIGSGGDKRAWVSSILNGYALGGFSVFFHDPTNNRPVNVSSSQYYQNDSNTFGLYNSQGGLLDGNPNHWQERDNDPASHSAGNYAFMAYLMTADRFHLHTMQGLANFHLIWLSPGTPPNHRGNPGSLGIMGGLQNRSVGWGLKDIARAAAFTPDSDALKSYFATIMANNAAFYIARYVTATQNNLGHLTGLYDGDTGIEVGDIGTKDWQNDYTTWSVAHAIDLGYTAFAPFRDWLFKCCVGRGGQLAGDAGYCFIEAALYYIITRGSSGPYDASWTAVYARNFSNLQQYACGSSGMGSAIGLAAGQMVNNNQSPAYYPQYWALALAAAVDAAFPGALAAWNLYWNAVNRLAGANASTDPRWCAYPRTLA